MWFIGHFSSTAKVIAVFLFSAHDKEWVLKCHFFFVWLVRLSGNTFVCVYHCHPLPSGLKTTEYQLTIWWAVFSLLLWEELRKKNYLHYACSKLIWLGIIWLFLQLEFRQKKYSGWSCRWLWFVAVSCRNLKARIRSSLWRWLELKNGWTPFWHKSTATSMPICPLSCYSCFVQPETDPTSSGFRDEGDKTRFVIIRFNQLNLRIS